MNLNTSFKQAYINAQICWNNNDYVNAKKWFLVSAGDERYRNKSLAKIIQIHLRQGKYLQARQMLNDNIHINSMELRRMNGLLETIENNFEQSKKYYSECMIDPDMQNISLLAIAKLYIQTGDYEIARKIFETLLFDDKFHAQSRISLICLNMLQRDFFEAKKLINEVDTSNISQKQLCQYKILDIYIKYFLGQLKASDNNFSPVLEYMQYRLFDHSENVLLNHIKKHCDQSERETNGCFFKDIDLKKLLYDARNKIENMNANHFQISDMYRFRLDNPIGYKDDFITNDLCVVTMIGTKDIITMYPVLLSDEFDKEGLTTSEQLKLKRLNGGSIK